MCGGSRCGGLLFELPRNPRQLLPRPIRRSGKCFSDAGKCCLRSNQTAAPWPFASARWFRPAQRRWQKHHPRWYCKSKIQSCWAWALSFKVVRACLEQLPTSVQLLLQFFKYHGCLNTVTAHQALASAAGSRNRVQAIPLCGLLIDDFLQFRQIAGAGSDKFFFQNDLQHNVVVVIAGCPGKCGLLLKYVKNAHNENLLFYTAAAVCCNFRHRPTALPSMVIPSIFGSHAIFLFKSPCLFNKRNVFTFR